MNIKYDIEDFEAVAKGETTVKELVKKYQSTPKQIRQALVQRGFHIRKQIKIVSPYKTMIVADKQKCADELGVSRSTIAKALKGEKIPTLDELNIQLSYVEEEE